MSNRRFGDFGRDASPLLSKLALAKVSEDLMSSPKEREDFMADPTRYVKQRYGVDVGQRERGALDDLVAAIGDGLCCRGCGCSSSLFEARVFERGFERGGGG